MWGHKILGDFLDKRKEYKGAGMSGDVIRHIERSLKTSHHFHIGDYNNLCSIFPPKGVVPFIDDTEDMIFPYNNCLFETYTVMPGVNPKKAFLTVYDAETDTFRLFIFMSIQEYRGLWMLSSLSYYVKIGSYFDEIESNVKFDLLWSVGGHEEKIRGMAQENCQPALVAIMLSLQLLNCPDVTTRIKRPSNALQKKRKKRKKILLFDYHTLVIHPHRIKQKSKDNQDLWKQKLHFCRAHKKYYPPESPLMGRHTGQFKWASQLRGDPRLGLLMKDYEVKYDKY